MAVVDVVIIVAFICYAIASGLRSKDVAGQNLEEYFLAGRTLPGWKAGLSMAATQFAADTPLLVTGLIATAGVFSIWRLWIYGVAFLVLGFILASSWRRAGVITDAELTEVRYGKRPAAILRGVKAIYFGTVFNCMVLAFVLLAATRIAEPFLVWDQWAFFPDALHGFFVDVVKAVGQPLTIVGPDPATWDEGVWIRSANNLISILAIVTVTTFYSTTGGLRSVVNTDVMQFGLMMVGTFLFTWIVVDRVGGLGAIPDAIQARFAAGGPTGITPTEILAFTPSMARDVTFAVLAVYMLQWIAQMNADGTGYLAQRSMACRSERDARQAAVWFTVAQVLVRSLMWIPLGLGLLLLFPPDLSLPDKTLIAEREATFVLGLASLPPGVLGLMLTGMLAALASTVDTHLNWGSSYWTNDIYKRFICQSWRKVEPSPRSLVWVARLSNILILLIALAIMSQLGSIATAWRISLLLGAGMGGVLILRWVWWRLHAWGELSAIVTSAILAPILISTMPGSDAHTDAVRLLIMFVASTATGVVVSLVRGAEDLDKLAEFYVRARPPGFWGPVANAAGEDPTESVRRLGSGMVAVIACSGTVFLLLTGFGSLIAGSPAPSWFPWRGPWISALVVVALMLIPVWWRHAFGRRSSESEAKV